MIGRRQDIASLQSDFYRIQYRRMLRWLTVSILIMFILVASIVYTLLARPQPKYYANTVEGRILDMPTPAS